MEPSQAKHTHSEKKCWMLLATMIRKLLKRSLLGSSILQCMSVFSSQELAQMDSSDPPVRNIKK